MTVDFRQGHELCPGCTHVDLEEFVRGQGFESTPGNLAVAAQAAAMLADEEGLPLEVRPKADRP